MKVLRQKRELKLWSRREEVCVALQHAARNHCLVKEWKDCEELKPKPKEKRSSIDKRSEGIKHRTEWCTVMCIDV